MVTWPGLRRVGHGSVRLIWAVKPLAAHPAAPIWPVARGINRAGCRGGEAMAMFGRLATFGTSTWNWLPIHAVDGAASAAGAAAINAVNAAISHAATRRWLLSPDIKLSSFEPFDRPRNYCGKFS